MTYFGFVEFSTLGCRTRFASLRAQESPEPNEVHSASHDVHDSVSPRPRSSVSCRCLANRPESRDSARDFPAPHAAALAIAGSAADPRTQEAMRLIEAFLAIEDAQARARR